MVQDSSLYSTASGPLTVKKTSQCEVRHLGTDEYKDIKDIVTEIRDYRIKIDTLKYSLETKYNLKC